MIAFKRLPKKFLRLNHLHLPNITPSLLRRNGIISLCIIAIIIIIITTTSLIVIPVIIVVIFTINNIIIIIATNIRFLLSFLMHDDVFCIAQ